MNATRFRSSVDALHSRNWQSCRRAASWSRASASTVVASARTPPTSQNRILIESKDRSGTPESSAPQGKRLFADAAATTAFRLVETRQTGSAAILTLEKGS